MRTFTVLSKSIKVEREKRRKRWRSQPAKQIFRRLCVRAPSTCPFYVHTYIEIYTAINGARWHRFISSAKKSREREQRGWGTVAHRHARVYLSSPLPGVTRRTCTRISTANFKSLICPFFCTHSLAPSPATTFRPPSVHPVSDLLLPRMFSLPFAVFGSPSSHCLHALQAG